MIKKRCPECKNIFKRKSQHQRNKYCSLKCYWKSLEKNVGEKSNQWKGGRKKHSYGYVLLYKPELTGKRYPYIAEHRLVMEKHLERSLTKKDWIHHLNGIKTDNRLGNLLLCKGAKGHANIHAEMEKCMFKLIQKGKVYYDRKSQQFKVRG